LLDEQEQPKTTPVEKRQGQNNKEANKKQMVFLLLFRL
jgi:hypothetical protein